VIACRSRVPLRSVHQLCALTGVSRSSLCESWRRAAPCGQTPKSFLDWLTLLRAASRKVSGTTWGAIAVQLRLDSDTLSRIAVRRVGLPLSEISASSIEALREEFRISALTPLGIRAPLAK
jgi:hypothetical protein